LKRHQFDPISPPFLRILKIVGVEVLHFVPCCVIIKAAAGEWGLSRWGNNAKGGYKNVHRKAT
jgi:hypothetical protein